VILERYLAKQSRDNCQNNCHNSKNTSRFENCKKNCVKLEFLQILGKSW